MFIYIIINNSIQSTISQQKTNKQKEHVNYNSIAFSVEKGLKSYIRPGGVLCWL